MMEESSDESAEIITKEEAEMAERQHQDEQKVSSTDDVVSTNVAVTSVSTVSPPAPLPSFLQQPPTAPLGMTTTTSVAPVAQMPVIPQQQTSTASPQVPPVTMPTKPQQVLAPGPVERPIDVSSSIEVPEGSIEMTPQSPQQGGGLFGWFSGNKLVSKVVEKTKSSMESMITTLDPGMKEIIMSGGDITIVVTSTKENKVGAIREAFQQVFGKATVLGKESQATVANQPVGFTAGLKGAEERIQNLRLSSQVSENQPVVSVEGFIVEMLPDRWYELSCLILQDPVHRLDLQTFSQPNPIPAEYILKAQDKTPSDYPLRWSGLAVSIGHVIEEAMPHIGHSDWQNAVVGVSRRESLFLAAKSLAYMYRQRLPTSFVS